MQLGIPALKYNRGDIREDGKVFYKYQTGCKNGERWITQEQFDKYKKQANEYGIAKYHENTDEWKARNKKWRDSNQEYNRQRVKDWRESNLERSKETCKRWGIENPEKKKESTKRWRDKNKKQFTDTQKAWRDQNKHIINFHSGKRRKLMQESFLMLHADQEKIIKTIYETSSRVGNCLNIPHEVDHIVPVTKGGHHVHTNLQVLPARINRMKYNKMPSEFKKN
jgi:hypothetical protein